MSKLDTFLSRCRDEKLIMGVLNVTPDSFFEGSRQIIPIEAVEYGVRQQQDGAAIIDIGGESTRPGAVAISDELERERLGELIATLSKAIDIPISIDTYKSGIARDCLRQGALVVNDIWGLQGDPEMAGVVADANAGVVVMHNNNGPPDDGSDIVTQVLSFFERSLTIAQQHGIPTHRILLDPGVGFGKTNKQAVDLLSRLGEFRALGCPLLLGLSRKSIFGVLGIAASKDRLAATLGGNLAGLAAGAAIVRVHDVREHRDAIEAFSLINGGRFR